MARLRLARARAAELIQDHSNPPETDEEQQQKCSPTEQEEEQHSSSRFGGRRRRPPPQPNPSSSSHAPALLWLSRWPGLASYSSRVARKRCAKGLPPPALPPVILRQATLQKSRSVESSSGRGSTDGGGGGSIASVGSLSRAPSLPSSLLKQLSTPHGRGGLVSGGDVFYDARGGSILTAQSDENEDGGAMTSELLRALAAEVEQQMLAEEKAAAAAAATLKSSDNNTLRKKAAESEQGELLVDDDDDEEDEGGKGSPSSSSDRASPLVLAREPGWHSSLSRPSRRLRKGLPPVCETGRRPSMWSLICSLFGKASHDLHSVSVPAHFNEPLTETQRHVEIMQHAHLLDAAATFPRESPARLLAVFGFACSLVSSCVRTSKPFKDLEGGTFEMVAYDDEEEKEEEAGETKEEEQKAGSKSRKGGRRFRALAEKVQHSPPVVAFCVQGENWTFEAHDELHVELGLRGLKMHPRGACRLTFIDKEEEKEEEKKKKSSDAAAKTSTSTSSSNPSSPSSLPSFPPRQPDEYRWNTPAFFVRDIVPSGQPGHMMRVSHKGPFFAKCMATGDAVVAVAAEADAKQARAAAAEGRALMSSVNGRYEPGPGRPSFRAEVSGRLDGVVAARVPREQATAGVCSCFSSSSSRSLRPLLGCEPRLFDGGGGRGFSGHAREALASWNGGEEKAGEKNNSKGGGGGGEERSPFVLLPLFRGTTAHHRSQRDCGPWGMSPWACSLNDAPPDLLRRLPLTDARRRRDVLLVESGDGDAADAEKERMEARQRVDRAAASRSLREWREEARGARGEGKRESEQRRRRSKEGEEEGEEDGVSSAAAASSPSAAAGGAEKKEGNDKGATAAAAAPSPTATETAATEPSASASKKQQKQKEEERKPRPFGQPRWFHSVPGTDVWGNPYSRWVYSGGYWEARESGAWPQGTRDPYC